MVQNLLKLKSTHQDAAVLVKYTKIAIKSTQKTLEDIIKIYKDFLQSVNPCWTFKSDVVTRLSTLHSQCEAYLDEHNLYLYTENSNL